MPAADLECVVNVSEGRDQVVIEALAASAGACLLDVHVDGDHHRSVLTLGGAAGELQEAVRALAAEAVRSIDLTHHRGAHPRLGALDVVPFVPLAGADLGPALAERDRFAAWAGAELGLPCFRYGPERPLPEIRRRAFTSLAPDSGPPRPHPTAGAACVGARPWLVAYNLWLAPGTPLEQARAVAAGLRGPQVRSLGLDVGGRAQVSCNLVDPLAVGPERVYDQVAGQAPVARAELVGLLPEEVLAAVPRARWAELDLDPSRTIEARLKRRDSGRSP